MCKVIGYCRVSTDTQDNANQKPMIEAYAENNGLTITGWIEVEEGSRKSEYDRRINEVMAVLGRKDHLLVVELSRLGRSMFEGVKIIDQLRKQGVTVHGIRDGVVTNGKSDAKSDFIISTQFFFAQTERERISERTKAALARKKAEGVQLGNPRLEELHAKQAAEIGAHAEGLRNRLTEMVGQGMSQRAILAQLNEEGVKTIRGNAWSLPYLQATLKRLELNTRRSRG